MNAPIYWLPLLLSGLLSCQPKQTDHPNVVTATTFGQDVDTLRRHTAVIVLRDGPRQVAVCPAYQGRVMTSTATGDTAAGFGYIDYNVVRSDSINPQFQSYGGEDRFWLGPQGGPYSVFFRPGDPQDFAHWQTPRPLNAEPFGLVLATGNVVRLHKRLSVQNTARTTFRLDVRREIRLLDSAAVVRGLGGPLPAGVQWVAFESDNELLNMGKTAWSPKTGLLSIWILGMFRPSATTFAILPVRQRPSIRTYFTEQLGPIRPQQLATTSGAVYLRTDGDYCAKIGLSPADVVNRSGYGWLGSYDAPTCTLTLVQYSLGQPTDRYVNSSWTPGDASPGDRSAGAASPGANPYAGDVVNVYNDGALNRQPRPERTFYELESSSPARALLPGEGIRHLHRTYHLVGEPAALALVSRQILGVGLQFIPAPAGDK